MMNQNKQLIIIGAGGHGSVIADMARLNGYTSILFLDDADNVRRDDYPVIGKVSDYVRYLSCADFIIAVGNNKARASLLSKLIEDHASIATLIHPQSVICEKSIVGQGTVIMAGAVVNSGATIGDGVILNTCCSVDHDCAVKDFAHISVGAHLCGTVTVGRRTFIGAGATVVNNISICGDVTVGAGAVVIRSITERGTYVGVPAKKLNQVN